MDIDALPGLGFLKNISAAGIFLFLIYVLTIFALKWIILLFLKKNFKSYWAQKSIIPTVEAILHWMTFYGTIVLFLFYFSKEKWLFASIYEVKGVKVSLFLIIVAFLIVTLASRLVKAFTAHVMPFFYERLGIETGMRYTISRLIYYAVMIAAFVVSLAIVGLDLKGITVILETLGVGIGFGLRNIAANFVSGLIILFERPLEVGETVVIENQTGKIVKINLRSTVVDTFGEGTLIVPNQYFIEHIVRNQTGDIMASVKVSIAYGNDTKLVASLLKEAVDRLIEQGEVLSSTPPNISFINILNSEMVFLVEAPVKNMEMKYKAESGLRHEVNSLFNQNNITLPAYPVEIVQAGNGKKG